MADTTHHQVVKFDPDNPGVDTRIGPRGSGNGQFNFPVGIGIDATGSVYVGDTENNRIQKFISDGVFISKWGSRGGGDGQFNELNGIAVDADGSVYVADTRNDRIQVFGTSP